MISSGDGWLILSKWHNEKTPLFLTISGKWLTLTTPAAMSGLSAAMYEAQFRLASASELTISLSGGQFEYSDFRDACSPFSAGLEAFLDIKLPDGMLCHITEIKQEL